MKNVYLLSTLALLLVPACAADGGGDANPSGSPSTGSGDTTVTTGSGAGGDTGSTSNGTGGMAPAPENVVLLIPDSSEDAIGIYDAEDGHFLGNFLEPNTETDAWVFSTPINAVQGPNGNIFVADQVEDAVLEFDTAGTYVGIFADGTDGLDNIRGIDFLGSDLLVTNSDGEAINRFDATGTALPDLVADVDFDPYDVLVSPTGDVLVSQIAPIDEVQMYPMGNPSGMSQLYATSFPQQISATPDGTFLVASFSDDTVTELTSAGQVVRTVTVESARGAYVLGNGNWLVTGGAETGILEVDPATGTTVTVIAEGAGFRFIEPVALGANAPR